MRSIFIASFLAVANIAGIANATTLPISATDFTSSARIETFEEQNSSALPTSSDFVIINNEGSPIHPSTWFAGDTVLFNTPDYPPTMFGTANFGNFYASGISNTSNFAIRFTSLQQAVGLWVARDYNYLHLDQNNVTFRVLDNLGNVLASQDLTLPPLGATPMFVGFKSDIGIRRAEVVGIQSPLGFFGVDNITYGTAVPEPSSCTLTALGGLAIVAVARRHAVSTAA